MRLLIVFLFLGIGSAFGNTYNLRLEAKEVSVSMTGSTSVNTWIYTELIGSVKSDVLIYQVGDTLNLKVVNTLSQNHGFKIDGIADFGLILPGDSLSQEVILNTEGVFNYYDPVNPTYNRYMGLSGILHVKSVIDNIDYFYWDLHEYNSQWNNDISMGLTPPFNQYSPLFYAINGRYHPFINSDPQASVTGTVGNEFRLIIINNGLSMHSVHFHGYHFEVINSDSPMLGWSKDTLPMRPTDILVLSCVPDKPGVYPVHDHNLVAVTGNGMYPSGMLTTISVGP